MALKSASLAKKLAKMLRKKSRQKRLVGKKKVGKKVWSVIKKSAKILVGKNISHLAKIWSLFADFVLPIRYLSNYHVI